MQNETSFQIKKKNLKPNDSPFFSSFLFLILPLKTCRHRVCRCIWEYSNANSKIVDVQYYIKFTRVDCMISKYLMKYEG